MLHSRTSLLSNCKWNSLPLPTPNAQSIPLLPWLIFPCCERVYFIYLFIFIEVERVYNVLVFCVQQSDSDTHTHRDDARSLTHSATRELLVTVYEGKLNTVPCAIW